MQRRGGYQPVKTVDASVSYYKNMPVKSYIHTTWSIKIQRLAGTNAKTRVSTADASVSSYLILL